jgi:hypothetical protein
VDVLIVFILIFGSIAVIGAVITIVVLINKRQKSMKKEHVSDEETRLDMAEQYRRMYGDRYNSNSK